MLAAGYPKRLIRERASFHARDHAQIACCRGSHNRLSFTYQLAFVRLLGRFPTQHPLELHDELAAFAAAELQLDADALQQYGRRQPTVSRHQEQIRAYLGLQPFGDAAAAALEAFIREDALRLEQTAALRARAEESLREWKILLPAESTLSRIIGRQRERAREMLFARMVDLLTPEHTAWLDRLLVVSEERTSPLQRLKEPPGFPSPKAVLRLADKLEQIAKIGTTALDLSWLNNNLQKALARRVERSSVYRLRELKMDHRHTVLVCFLRQLERDITDQMAEMHGRLITETYRRAQKRLDESMVRDHRSVRTNLVSFRTIGEQLLNEQIESKDLRDTVFKQIPPEQLRQQVSNADRWLADTPADTFDFVVARFNYLRQFSPTLLNHLHYELEPNGSPSLLKAVEILRQMNAEGTRKLPPDAPMDFVPERIRRLVISPDGAMNRGAYECAVLTALRDELTRGNLWIRGSKRYRQLDEFFLPAEGWEHRREQFFATAKLPADSSEIVAFLHNILDYSYDRSCKPYQRMHS